MLLSELDSCDIGILGAGREGMAAWHWLRRHFPSKCLTVYDEAEDVSAQQALMDASLDQLVIGPFETGTLSGHDLLIRSPGISPYRPELALLRKQGMRFSSASSLWFAQHPHAKTICVTGTKGKSTTAALVAHLLHWVGCNACLAGNIGQPLLECDDAGVDWWVIELSSYQLYDLEAAPSLAAFTNLSDEHLDWHAGVENYQRDKMRLASLAGDAPLIANRSDPLLSRYLENHPGVCWFETPGGYHVRQNELWHGDERIEGVPRHSLPGTHNLVNLCAALTIVEKAGFSVDNPALALETFTGLPHRLQRLGTRYGINYVNDSLSTTPVATVAALEALQGERVILLAGGMDRGLDWQPLMPHMKEQAPVAVICLPDNGVEIAQVMRDAGLAPAGGIQCATDLGEAMVLAEAVAQSGDTILLSPGAPSFPRFRDYEDRGLQFAQLAGFREPA